MWKDGHSGCPTEVFVVVTTWDKDGVPRPRRSYLNTYIIVTTDTFRNSVSDMKLLINLLFFCVSLTN